MAREETKPASANDPQQVTGQQQAEQRLSALSDQERVLLDVLVACGTARTPAQLSAACGLPRDEVENALGSLRTKGFVTQFNTLVESYGARFPGLELR